MDAEDSQLIKQDPEIQRVGSLVRPHEPVGACRAQVARVLLQIVVNQDPFFVVGEWAYLKWRCVFEPVSLFDGRQATARQRRNDDSAVLRKDSRQPAQVRCGIDIFQLIQRIEHQHKPTVGGHLREPVGERFANLLWLSGQVIRQVEPLLQLEHDATQQADGICTVG